MLKLLNGSKRIGTLPSNANRPIVLLWPYREYEKFCAVVQSFVCLLGLRDGNALS